MSNWFVYIILCSDDTLYTGITTDLQRRFNAHKNGRQGAKYFRGRMPLQVVYLEGGHNRSSASKRELDIKSMTVKLKRKLIASNLNEIQ